VGLHTMNEILGCRQGRELTVWRMGRVTFICGWKWEGLRHVKEVFEEAFG
jgi:hypothetical protein